MTSYEGRPHWGKRHYLDVAQVKRLVRFVRLLHACVCVVFVCVKIFVSKCGIRGPPSLVTYVIISMLTMESDWYALYGFVYVHMCEYARVYLCAFCGFACVVSYVCALVCGVCVKKKKKLYVFLKLNCSDYIFSLNLVSRFRQVHVCA